ncbi:MAG TPA: hypothetical protein PKD27_08890, partial [Tepidiformaceae bacterium]|nr:hypothetical protein [Tepidiformaceae bacterium]
DVWERCHRQRAGPKRESREPHVAPGSRDTPGTVVRSGRQAQLLRQLVERAVPEFDGSEADHPLALFPAG